MKLLKTNLSSGFMICTRFINLKKATIPVFGVLLFLCVWPVHLHSNPGKAPSPTPSDATGSILNAVQSEVGSGQMMLPEYAPATQSPYGYSAESTSATALSEWNLPPRSDQALTGSELEVQLRGLPLSAREDRIFQEITAGNVPGFLRTWVPVSTQSVINGVTYTVEYLVTPDYLAVGSDDNYFLMPMTPLLAQRLGNHLGFSLPTRRMVDQIWAAAPLKLSPQTIPPDDQMTTIPVMFNHNQMVRQQREAALQQHPQGTLVGGHKKDVIVSNRIHSQPPPGRVVIYGWHYTNGTPIQPVYSGHAATYADYSHGIRAVRDTLLLNGEPVRLRDLLSHPEFHVLLSDEGRIEQPFYPLASTRAVPDSWAVERIDATSLRLRIPHTADINAYRVHLSDDGRLFNKTVTLPAGDDYLLEGLPSDIPVFIRMQAITDHAGSYSEVLAGLPSAKPPSVLVVNGFDRPITGNTRDFIRMYVPGLMDAGLTFDAATNEAIAAGLTDLSDYETVIWILGAESTVDETFSTTEQNRVRAFLDGGGNLLVSGSEIGWDLDHRGNTTDRSFMHNYLKSAYVADAPSNQQNTWYEAKGTPGSPFSTFQHIRFDDGSKGTWNVSWPDVLRGEHGGEVFFSYAGAPAPNGAGVAYRGPFPGSDAGVHGSVMVLGFPLETVYPDADRNTLLTEILHWMVPPASNVNHLDNQEPQTLFLEQNYPNPFNNSTTLQYHLPENTHVQLIIYTPLGQTVVRLVDSWQPAGQHQIRWETRDLASGIYIGRLTADGHSYTRTMLLVK